MRDWLVVFAVSLVLSLAVCIPLDIFLLAVLP